MRHENIRKSDAIDEITKLPLDDAFLDYNGGCEDYEDPADYIRSGRRVSFVNGTVIA